MEDFTKCELLAYLRAQKLAVIATVNGAGTPEAAPVRIAVSDKHELIFDTISSSRKHANLVLRPRVAVTFTGPGDQTLQYEGIAFPISALGAPGADYCETYRCAWPEGRERLSCSGLVYWGVTPVWARYSDFEREPLIAEFDWHDL